MKYQPDYVLFFSLFFLSIIASAQEWGHLVDPVIRSERATEMAVIAAEKQHHAWELATAEGWAPRWMDGDTVYELMAIEDGRVIVYKTFNRESRISIAADLVQGISPYFVSGNSIAVGVWDGGSILTTHQELSDRVNILQSSDLSSHATHVAGTIGASGVVSRAKGMAPGVVFDSYYFNSDTAEMTSRAMSYSGEPDKIAISNHSYGIVAGWDYVSGSLPRWHGTWGSRESDMFGNYTSDARDWDNLCYGAPYYLPIKAAGNDRNDNAPAEGQTFEYRDKGPMWRTKAYDSTTDPYSDGWKDGGFDTLPPKSCAKNILTVGAVNDAVYNGQRDISRATMTSFSSWGPTDDGRIKPDVVTNGASVYSPISTGNSSYANYSGTSMAAPAASGAAALLTEFHKNLFGGQYMLSSTLKALIIHTADDLGRSGPDYTFGWGLLNTRYAADVLKEQAEFPDRPILISNDLLNTDVSHSYTLEWSGMEPIRATLCWTDPPGSIQSGLNNRTPRLVNNLDLRIYAPDGTIYFPFILDVDNPLLTAERGDNTVDNVEQVYIHDPPMTGNYTVVVSYKGSLTNQHQVYSLILTGHRLTPAAVSDLSVTVGPNCGQVELKWSPVPEADGYILFYQEGANHPPFFPTTDGTPASGTDLGQVSSVIISGLDATSTYYFAVQGYNDKGTGELSNVVNATPNLNCSITISGAVKTYSGYGIPNVLVTAIDLSSSAMTDIEGNYSLSVPLGWTEGGVQLNKADWWFEPTERFYVGPVQENVTDENYLGTKSADFHGDGIVAFNDFAFLAEHWLADDCNLDAECTVVDLDLSGMVDLQDFQLMIFQWLDL